MPGYGAFADESRHMEGRYRCIAAISLPVESVVPVSDRLAKILKEARLEEFKWRDLRRTGPRQKCALGFVEVLVDEAIGRALRADVLVWDTEDARHNVENRDDIGNYERMFYHLHRFLIGKREGGAVWHLRPDQQVQIDWGTLGRCLRADGTWRRTPDYPPLVAELTDLLPRIRTLKQVDSEATPLCQLADLLAGMAAYTRERSDVMRHLRRTTAGQGSLFDDASTPAPSKSDRARFPVACQLSELSRRHRLGASLGDRGYFRTHTPNSPLNFWHYEPRSAQDRAPSREMTERHPATTR